MKTLPMFKMIKLPLACLFVVLLSSLSTQALAEGGSHGGGGAGIKRHGQYLTFGSAGIRLSSALQANELPGFDILMKGLSVPFAPKSLGKIITHIPPSSTRHYFPLSKEQLGEEKRKELLAVYQEIIGEQVPAEALEIFGITIGSDTYLLPEFFELKKKIEQAAILYHESLWVYNPTLTYDEILEAEITTQEYLERLEKGNRGFDIPMFSNIVNLTKTPIELVISAFHYDILKSSLSKKVNGKLGFRDTFTKDQLTSVAETLSDLITKNVTDKNNIWWGKKAFIPQERFFSNIRELQREENLSERLSVDLSVSMQKFPDLQFLKALFEVRENVKIELPSRSTLWLLGDHSPLGFTISFTEDGGTVDEFENCISLDFADAGFAAQTYHYGKLCSK